MSSPSRPFRLSWRAVFAFVCVAFFPRAAPAEGFVCRTWTANDGLPDNTAGAAVQSPAGFLWVSTQGSLARFDGVRFTREPLGPLPPLTIRMIRALHCDRQGALWMPLENGSVLHLQNGKVTNIPVPTPTTRDWAASICEDREGGVWLGFERGRICRVVNGEPTFFQAQDGVPRKSRARLCTDVNGRVWFCSGDQLGYFRDGRFITLVRDLPMPLGICPSRHGGLWLTTPTGLRYFDESSGFQEERPFPEPDRPRDAAAVLEDRQGRVWVANFAGGLLCWDGSRFTAIDTPSDDVLSLHEDREGNIWAGAEGGGLNRIQPCVAEIFGADHGLTTTIARSGMIDPDGLLWIASRDGNLGLWNREGLVRQLPRPQWGATCVAVDSARNVWVGSGNGGVFQLRDDRYSPAPGPADLASDCVRAIFAASNDDLWIAGETSGLHRFRRGEMTTFQLPTPADHVRAFAEENGRLWAGTLRGQLFRLESGELHNATPANMPPDASIRTLSGGDDEVVWIGFAEHGLGQIKGGRFSHLGTSAGLWDDAISQILPDAKGSLWLGGNRGVFRMKISDYDGVVRGGQPRLRVQALGTDSGVPALQASFGYFPNAAPVGDRLAFCTSKGLLLVNPSALGNNSVVPPVEVTSLEMDGAPLPLTGGVRLGSRHQRLTIHFTAYSFAAPENVLFRYRLAGFEDSWTEPLAQRSATYARVPPGRYLFEVIASNNDGLWNETGARLAVTIVPAFWQTPWFRTSTFLAVAVLGTVVGRYAFLRRLRGRLRLLEREAAIDHERARIARDMHDELGANLTQIALLGDLVRRTQSDGAGSSEHAQRISTAARQSLKSLDEIVWAVNPRNDLLANLLEYLGQFAIEYLSASEIRCRIEFPDLIPPRVLPADMRHHLFLAAKETLHNIVKHSAANEVWMRVSLTEAGLRLSIEDNGRGFQMTEMAATEDGLRNIESRMNQAGGSASIQTKPGHGARVDLALPWPRF